MKEAAKHTRHTTHNTHTHLHPKGIFSFLSKIYNYTKKKSVAWVTKREQALSRPAPEKTPPRERFIFGKIPNAIPAHLNQNLKYGKGRPRWSLNLKASGESEVVKRMESGI